MQNQTGKSPRAWDKTGKVLEVLDYNSYLVKIDGSRHVTKRNRRFLRKIIPFRTFPSDAPKGSHVLPPQVKASDHVDLHPVDPDAELPHHVQPSSLPPDPTEDSQQQPDDQPIIPKMSIPRKKIKERWILAKPKPQPSSSEVSSADTQFTPPETPSPNLIEEYQQQVKDLAEASRLLSMVISSNLPWYITDNKDRSSSEGEGTSTIL